jgi:hypothetical protein
MEGRKESDGESGSAGSTESTSGPRGKVGVRTASSKILARVLSLNEDQDWEQEGRGWEEEEFPVLEKFRAEFKYTLRILNAIFHVSFFLLS